jgi:hypothetical protein
VPYLIRLEKCAVEGIPSKQTGINKLKGPIIYLKRGLQETQSAIILFRMRCNRPFNDPLSFGQFMKISLIITVFIGLGILGCATRPIDSVTIFVIRGRVLDKVSNFPLEDIKVYFVDTGYDYILSKKQTPLEIGRSNSRGMFEARLNYWWGRKKSALHPVEATFDIVLSGEPYESRRFHYKESELKSDGLAFLVDLEDIYLVRENAKKTPEPEPSGNANGSTAAIWTELLQKSPYPHTAPLPPHRPTALDGVYTKFDPKKTPPVPCRRCPDYMPEGGIWKLNLNNGIFRIFHEISGWRSIGSFVVDGNQIRLFNDPSCMEVMGSYTWTLKEGRLRLPVIQDECAIGLRAENLTKLSWMSCQPPLKEAGTSGHWQKPSGCD